VMVNNPVYKQIEAAELNEEQINSLTPQIIFNQTGERVSGTFVKNIQYLLLNKMDKANIIKNIDFIHSYINENDLKNQFPNVEFEVNNKRQIIIYLDGKN